MMILSVHGQHDSSALDRITHFPSGFFNKMDHKMSHLEGKLDRQTERYLAKLANNEKKLSKELYLLDSNAAKNLYHTSPEQQYAILLNKMRSDTLASHFKPTGGEYYPYVDSLQGTLAFLYKTPQLLSTSGVGAQEIQATMAKLNLLQSKMQDADQIKQYIQQRKEQLKAYLLKYTTLPPGISQAYQDYNESMYYYSEQVREYKEMLNDPDKMMKTALSLLNRVPAFTEFIKSNSILSGIFSLPGAYNPSLAGQGLPARDQVLAAFQNQSGVGGPNINGIVQQNVQSAQGQVDQLRDKISSYGNSGSADVDIPNFQPNPGRTKSFFQRLQFGTDMQTERSSYFFPATTDVGVSVGYKLGGQNVIGVGGSYKVGLGQDISHIKISGQGASLRSFIDIHLKKSFFASGGFEYNYQQPLAFADYPILSSWQKSGLIGVSKTVSLKTKFLKSSKVQLLWDYLSYSQVPRTSPIKFRIGYCF